MARPDLIDLCALLGLLGVTVGSYLIWPPLGALVPGVLLLAVAWVGVTRRR